MTAEQKEHFYAEIEMVKRNVPCWYELSWQQNPQSLILKIHQDFIKDTGLIPANVPVVRFLSESFKFSNFGLDFSQDIGFENIFKNKGSDERGFVVYQAEIPQIKKITDIPCSHCKGTKYNEVFDNDCFYCEKTGKEIASDPRPAFILSASLTALTRYLNLFIKQETSANFPQLLTLETITESELHGGSLGGSFGLKLRSFIKSQDEQTLKQIIVPAMMAANDKMLGKRDYISKYQFRILKWDNGGLCISCPGDACGINPNHNASYDMGKNWGYEFSSHNVDTPSQQITLIAGLAALHDAARKGM